MIVHQVEQGGYEWLALHVGKPSAGGFANIITPKTWKPSESSAYRNKILAEWWLGVVPEDVASAWMERGLELEKRARSWYEFTYDVKVEQVGFIERDDRSCGCSPDGLIGDEGLLQIKCYSAANHVGVMLNPLKTKHLPQILGEMAIAERKWTDLVFWHPMFEPVVQRIEWDQDLIDGLESALATFNISLAESKTRMIELCGQPRATYCEHGVNATICRQCKEEPCPATTK